MLAAPNALMITGGATTVIEAFVVLPAPPSVEVTWVLLFFTLVTQTALDNNPCNKARTFQCDSGPAHATVDSDRRIVTLLIDAPLR